MPEPSFRAGKFAAFLRHCTYGEAHRPRTVRQSRQAPVAALGRRPARRNARDRAGGETVAASSLAGYLNIIYPNKIQIIGTEELGWLDGLDSRQRWEMIEKIMGFHPTALIVTKDQAVPADLRDAANESRHADLASARSAATNC